MAKPKETKHQKFKRLAERRMTRLLEEMRLLSQLASPNYEHTVPEAQILVTKLDETIRYLASVYGVEYVSRVGRGKYQTASGAQVGLFNQKGTVMDTIAVAKALDHLRSGRLTDVEQILSRAIQGDQARAS